MNELIQIYKRLLTKELQKLNLEFIHESDNELIIEYDGLFVFHLDFNEKYKFFERFRAKLVREGENNGRMDTNSYYTELFLANYYTEIDINHSNYSNGKVIDNFVTITTIFHFDKIRYDYLQNYIKQRKKRKRKEKINYINGLV